MTPSLPTFSIASAMIRPMVSSWFAEIVPTWAIIGPVTGLDCALSDADDGLDGFGDAAFDGHRLAPAVTFFAPSR